MNLPNFLNLVDAVTRELSKEDLEEFVHQNARTVTENKRSAFLSALKKIAEKSSGKKGVETILHEETKESRDEIQQIMEELQPIVDGEISMVGNLNEEYDDWYDSVEDEFLYEDPQGILTIIQRACDMVDRCMDSELYEEAAHLAETLLDMRISLEGDCVDYGCDDELSLQDLAGKDLISGNFKEWVYKALLAAYLSHGMEERPAALYRMLEQVEWERSFSLGEWIQQHGESLEGLEAFLPLWLDYLGQQNTTDVEKLLVDAVSLMSQPELSIAAARKYAEIHPSIYERVLQERAGEFSDEEWYALGQEAMEKVSTQYRIRGRIALLTAEFARKLGRVEEAEHCWLESFRSATTPLQYLKMAVNCQDFSRYREEMRQIIHCHEDAAQKDAFSIYPPSGELGRNSVTRNDYYLLLFLDGQFENVMNGAMQVRKYLGWSSTFMKLGIAWFMLYLYRTDALRPGMRKMLETAHWTIHAPSGGWMEDEENLAEALPFSLWSYFCKWREQMPMSEEFQKMLLLKMEHWISGRTESIVGGQHRKHYGECAAYIAALGEVRESRGDAGAAQRIFAEYRERYPRHRAFHEELRAFGMTGSKSKR